MAIQLPPVVKTSKKKIPGTRIFDSSRVFADYDAGQSHKSLAYSSHYASTFDRNSQKKSQGNLNQPKAGLVNKPNPTNVHFLFDNPRLINEPVCHASSKASRSDQHNWWPDELAKEVKLKPSYSKESSNRHDFTRIANRPQGLTRFSCSQSSKVAAVGIVPVSQLGNGKTRTEKISYEHMFDSRRARTERGRLHGAFVWDANENHDAKLQPKRRYAKRYFASGETLDMTDCSDLPPSSNQSDFTEIQSGTLSVPRSQESPKQREKLDPNQGIPPKQQLYMTHQQVQGKKEENRQDTNVWKNDEVTCNDQKSQLSSKRLSLFSPPPHVC
eukprot:gene9301-10282_t